jgi:hypothetical protein
VRHVVQHAVDTHNIGEIATVSTVAYAVEVNEQRKQPLLTHRRAPQGAAAADSFIPRRVLTYCPRRKDNIATK